MPRYVIDSVYNPKLGIEIKFNLKDVPYCELDGLASEYDMGTEEFIQGILEALAEHPEFVRDIIDHVSPVDLA